MEKKQKIDVVVQGLAGSGKTTIIRLIEKALEAEDRWDDRSHDGPGPQHGE